MQKLLQCFVSYFCFISEYIYLCCNWSFLFCNISTKVREGINLVSLTLHATITKVTADWREVIRNQWLFTLNLLNPELNPICYLLALIGAHHFLHVSSIRVKLLTLRRLMSYIYGAPILDVSRSHTTTQHSR